MNFFIFFLFYLSSDILPQWQIDGIFSNPIFFYSPNRFVIGGCIKYEMDIQMTAKYVF